MADDLELKRNYVRETRSDNYRASLSLEMEPDNNIEIHPHTYEEDRYIKMKDLYKQGKKDAEDLLGAGVTADQMAQEYTDDPDLIQQYLNGWNLVVHLSKED